MLFSHYATESSSICHAMRQSVYLLCLIVLAGCTSNVKQLHDLNPPADNFPSALASEYQAYADSEMEQGRSSAAEHYAGKGLKALQGEAVEPDDLDSSLAADQRQDLTEARTQLVKLETDDMKKISAQKLARAQLLFDCWQHELTKGLNQAQAPCADEFHSTISELQEISDALVFGKEVKRIVIFSPKSTVLNDEAKATVRDIEKEVHSLDHYSIELKIYSGIKASQRRLTESRVNAVKKGLIKAGIPAQRIHIRKFGSAKAVVLSRDRKGHDTKKVRVIVKMHIQSKES